MVAPRLPSHSKRKRRRHHHAQQSQFQSSRVLLIPLLLAGMAISWNIVRLCRSLFQPSTIISLNHPAWKYNYDWCRHRPDCQFALALDLQDFYPEESSSLLEDIIPDPEDLQNMFEADDDNDETSTTQKQDTNSNQPLTDDLDHHPDHFGNFIATKLDRTYPPTPRILVAARRNQSVYHSTRIIQNTTHFQLRLQADMASRSSSSGHFALLSRRGLGESHIYNQDRAILVDPFPLNPDKSTHKHKHNNPLQNTFFLGIFDGHGQSGHIRADHAAATLPRLLLERLVVGDHPEEAHVRSALSSAFWDVHRQGPASGGCTASVVFRWRHQLYFANTGDSRSMLLEIDTQHLHLNMTYVTHPHKPNDPAERRRIVNAGCVVIEPIPRQDATARVTDSLDGSGMALAMSRSLGDYDLQHCGVIPEPTITVVNLAEPKYKHKVLLAVSVTDGVFDTVPLDELAHALAVPFWKDNTYVSASTSPLELAAEDIIRTASDRWLVNATMFPYRDDITIAVRRVQ